MFLVGSHTMQCNTMHFTFALVHERSHEHYISWQRTKHMSWKCNPTKNNNKLILSKKFCGYLLFAFGSHTGFFFRLCSIKFVCAQELYGAGKTTTNIRICFCWHMFTMLYFVYACLRSHCAYTTSTYTHRFRASFYSLWTSFVRFLIHSNTLSNAMGKCKRSARARSRLCRPYTLHDKIQIYICASAICLYRL